MNKQLAYAVSDCLLTWGPLLTGIGVIADLPGLSLVAALASLAGAAIHAILVR